MFGIDIKRLAIKATRDFIAIFIGSSAFLAALADGGVVNTNALLLAAGSAASIAITRVLRDLGVPGMGGEVK